MLVPRLVHSLNETGTRSEDILAIPQKCRNQTRTAILTSWATHNFSAHNDGKPANPFDGP
jgi:hypothetical protein